MTDDLLLQLRDVSLNFFSEIPVLDTPFFSPLDGPDFLLPIPELSLDIPPLNSLTSVLRRAGASPSLASQLSRIHHNYASQLAEEFARSYRESCLEISSSVPSSNHLEEFLKLQRLGRHTYAQSTRLWSEELYRSVRSKARSSDSAPNNPERKRMALDRSSVAVLEAIFRENPKPNRAVKEALAKKTGMTTRQIAVWFQNHRSRAREEGTCFSDQSKTVNMSESRTQRKPHGRTGCSSRKPSGHKETARNVADKETCAKAKTLPHEEKGRDVLSCNAPVFAFPTVYPPDVDEDPFPCRFNGRISFPRPQWQTQSYLPSSRPSVGVLTVSCLADTLSRLSITDGY